MPERTDLDANGNAPPAGEVLNERGEWEDEASLRQRAEEASDSIRIKLLRCRRAYAHRPDLSGKYMI